jgi:hypothetical protein
MGLENLVGISLEQIMPAKETVKRLLDAVTGGVKTVEISRYKNRQSIRM